MTSAWRRWLPAAVLAFAAGACGEEGPAGPVPQVAGTYSGSFAVRFLVDARTTTGSMRVVVEQAGENVTITGSLDINGAAAPLPPATGTLDATGFLELADGGFSSTVNQEFCGNTRTISSTLTFFARGADVSEHADTQFCGRVLMSASLARQ